jgi:hypothetical protein
VTNVACYPVTSLRLRNLRDRDGPGRLWSRAITPSIANSRPATTISRVPASTSTNSGLLLHSKAGRHCLFGHGALAALALGTIVLAAIMAAATALVVPKFLSLPPQKDSALAPADTRSPVAEPQASEPRLAVTPDRRQAIASLVVRGKELLRDGDFSSARLILQRAVDAGEADAALTLGATYDPGILAQLGIRSQVANVDLARTWYEKAQEFGSAEASSRLKRLPNR